MKHLLLTLILLFSFTGCGEDETKAKHDAQIEKDALLAEIKTKDLALQVARKEIQEAKAKLVAQEQAQKEALIKEQLKQKEQEKQVVQNKKLSNVGINVDDNKITIDTNKAKDFLKILVKP